MCTKSSLTGEEPIYIPEKTMMRVYSTDTEQETRLLPVRGYSLYTFLWFN